MAHGDDLVVVGGDRFDLVAGAGDDGGADEDSGNGFFDAFDLDGVFEAVDLGSEGVAADGDVEEVEGVLVTAFDFFGHEDHSHTRAPDGHALFGHFLNGSSETVAFHEEADGGGFSAGKDEAVDLFQVFREPGLLWFESPVDWSSRWRESTCLEKSPWMATTPTTWGIVGSLTFGFAWLRV